MWRLLLVVAVAGLGLAACGDELSVEEEFVKLMEKARAGTFTVTYDREGPRGSGEPITWYRMGEFGRTDVDFAPRVSPAIEAYRLTELQGPMGSYRCSEVATNTTYGLEGCVLEPTNNTVITSGPPSFLSIAISRPQVLHVERMENRTIAGVDTRCFDVEADRGDGPDMDVCLTSDGVPFYLEIPIPNIDSRVVYTATSVSDEVPDDVFLPPMEVVGAGPLCSGPNRLANCGPQEED